MSLSETSLFLERSSIPSAQAVERQVAASGYAIEFPQGFGLADEKHSGWLPVTLDGTEAGFDYYSALRDQYVGDDPAAACYPQFGDTVLSFVARHHQSSLLAASLVQRAICELSEAHGWWHEGEEHLQPKEMSDFLNATIKAIESDPAPPPDMNIATGLSARVPPDYFKNIGKAILAGLLAIAIAALFIFLMGYFFAPGAKP